MLGWNFPDDDATTLAGLVMHQAQCIPEEDSIYEMGDFMFQILDKKGTQLTRIKIRQTVSEDNDDNILTSEQSEKDIKGD